MYHVVSIYEDEPTEYMAFVTYHNSATDARKLLWTTVQEQACAFPSLTSAAEAIEARELENELLDGSVKIIAAPRS